MFKISIKTDKRPIVSIIITTFNRSKYLKRAIDSVLSQTFKNLELIIIDDCSTDKTEEIVRSIKDNRVRYHKHKTNLGVHKARSNGIKISKGEFIGFLDDDDEYLPKKIEKQVRLFKKLSKEYGLIYSGYYTFNGKKIISQKIPLFRGDVRKIIIGSNILGTSTVLVRRFCFDKVGFFEYMPSIEDWDMWIRISEYYKFDFVPEPLNIYYVHETQVSMNTRRLIIGRDIMLKKYKMIWGEYPKILSNRLNDLGRLYCFSNYSNQSKKYFIESIRVKLFQTNAYLNILFGKFLTKKFSHIFTSFNTVENILKTFLVYFKKKILLKLKKNKIVTFKGISYFSE